MRRKENYHLTFFALTEWKSDRELRMVKLFMPYDDTISVNENKLWNCTGLLSMRLESKSLCDRTRVVMYVELSIVINTISVLKSKC